MTRSRAPILPCLFLILAAVPALAFAQAAMVVQLSAGTGFFINKEGHIITNAHVVRACQSISVLTEKGEIPATLTAEDVARDLAVLHVDSEVPAIAPLRWNISDLKPGDNVVVMGYPGQAGVEGHSTFVRTNVIGLIGPTGEPERIQLQSVAQHGNSGGPVLDTTGNVIAVISGKAETYKLDERGAPSAAPVHEADVAITLASLQDFLNQNRVPFYQAASGGNGYADGVLEQNARHFIVAVRCIQGIRPAN